MNETLENVLKKFPQEYKRNFIRENFKSFQQASAKSGVPVSVIIGQSIKESGWNHSSLARRHHNYFGIKAGSRWTGKTTNMFSREYDAQGDRRSDFRSYDSPHEGIMGYADLMKLERYRGMREADNYLEAIQALSTSGYATDRRYSQGVKSLVEKYNLDQLDSVDAGQTKKVAAEQVKQKPNDEIFRDLFSIAAEYDRDTGSDPRRYGLGAKIGSKGKIDCSGLISAMMKRSGVDLNYGSANSAYYYKEFGGRTMDSNYQPQVGDLVYSYNSRWGRIGHIGIVTEVTGDGKIKAWHSSGKHDGVKETVEKFGPPGRGNYWTHFSPGSVVADVVREGSGYSLSGLQSSPATNRQQRRRPEVPASKKISPDQENPSIFEIGEPHDGKATTSAFDIASRLRTAHEQKIFLKTVESVCLSIFKGAASSGLHEKLSMLESELFLG